MTFFNIIYGLHLYCTSHINKGLKTKELDFQRNIMGKKKKKKLTKQQGSLLNIHKKQDNAWSSGCEKQITCCQDGHGDR